MRGSLLLHFLVCGCLVGPNFAHAQSSYAGQKDLPDIFREWFPKLKPRKTDSTSLNAGQRFVTLIPNIGYTPQSNLLLQTNLNIAFRNPGANVTVGLLGATYTQNNQAILQGMFNYFSKENRWFFSSDWRFMHYPQATYGLGMNTDADSTISMDYQYLRLYQTAMRRVLPNLYVGVGYELDIHSNIESWNATRELHRISHYRYGVQGKSVSSGMSLNVLYDNRTNALNSTQGFYANLMWRQNLTLLGSDRSYRAFQVDMRKYVRLPTHYTNVLAFWGYGVFTNGTPPFLDLPSTGWDTFSNSGRGFIQGRFRGKSLLYFEVEYRFQISQNQLFGGVLFTNWQGVSETRTNQFTKFVPAFGGGLRIRINKYTRSNLAIDYGIGADGSHNIYFNVGEVF